MGGTDLGADAVALQVNGINVEGLRHSEVVSHIKSQENEARLLVVDPETDEYFKKLGVTPTEDHTKGETLFSWGDPVLVSHRVMGGIPEARESHVSLVSSLGGFLSTTRLFINTENTS